MTALVRLEIYHKQALIVNILPLRSMIFLGWLWWIQATLGELL